MELLGIQLGMTSAFHPQGDGQSERTNQTVEMALRCFMGGNEEHYDKWVDYLPIVEHEYNSTVNDTTGPFRITEKLSPLSYRLQLPADARMHDVVSIVHLRRFHGDNQELRPLPVLVDEQEEYEVERIDGQRSNAQGSNEYLVKWKGYGEKERTWEPLSNLQHADEAIATWHSSQVEANDKKARPNSQFSDPLTMTTNPKNTSIRVTRAQARRERELART